MSTYAIIFALIISSIVIVALVLFLHRRRLENRSDQLVQKEPTLDDICNKEEKLGAAEEAIKTVSPPANDIIILYVLSNADRPYVGYELLQAILSAGLRFGEMSIFHYYEDGNARKNRLFSLASATKPGTFDLPKMGAHTSKGLSMFMELNPENPLMTSFEKMISIAKQLVEDLSGSLLNEHHEELTEEMIDQWRKQVEQLELKQRTPDLFDV